MHVRRSGGRSLAPGSSQASVPPAITREVSIATFLARLLHGKWPRAFFPVLPARSGLPSMYDYDMVVIGSGPSGRRAAVQFAKLGKSVLVVEKGRRVGGVSVHTGTIPSKTLRETVLNLSGWRERGFYGRSYRVKQDIGAVDLIARLQKTLDHEVEVLEHQFSRNTVKTACGEARFVGPNLIEITAAISNSKTDSASYVLIASVPSPFRPDYVPFDGKTGFDSDEIIDLPKLPRSLAVIGAGVIGVEYATIFSALDVAVTLIAPRPTPLAFIAQH